MDLNLLRAFVRVAEEQSFSRAAERLGLPKSSVSRMVGRLEESLGVRLLQRTTRSLALTSAGALVFDRAQPLLGPLESAAERVPEREEQPSGLLRVTTTPDLGSGILAEALARFTRRHPQVHVEVRLTLDVVDLVKEGFDLALRVTRRPLRDSSMVARRLGTVDLALYASPTYLAHAGTPRAPGDLAAHRMVLFQRVPLRLNAGAESAAVKVTPAMVSDDVHFLREAMAEGAGIGLLQPFMAQPHVESGRLVRVLPRWALRAGTLWMVTPTSRLAPRKVSAFSAALVDAVKSRAWFGA